jgi:tetratricopeptide (TPR) repeat protein
VTAAGSALDDANQAVELNEDYEGWHILKGSILYAMGKAEEAEESYNRAAELNDAVSTRDEGTEASKKEIEASLKRMEEFPWTMPER